jgi:hypothetical protein
MHAEEGKEVGYSQPPSPILDDAIEENAAAVTQPTNNVNAVDEIPEGGYGWVCTFACAVINAHTWGMNSVWRQDCQNNRRLTV